MVWGRSMYSGDELELIARISAAGWNGAYDPKPVVYHHHGRKTANHERRLRWWYDRGRGAYYAKCILNREMRKVYVKNWLLTQRSNSQSEGIWRAWRTMARKSWQVWSTLCGLVCPAANEAALEKYCIKGSVHERESIPLTEYFPIFRVPEYSE